MTITVYGRCKWIRGIYHRCRKSAQLDLTLGQHYHVHIFTTFLYKFYTAPPPTPSLPTGLLPVGFKGKVAAVPRYEVSLA